MDRQKALDLICEYIIIVWNQQKLLHPSAEDLPRFIRLNSKRINTHEKIAKEIGIDLVRSQEPLWNLDEYGLRFNKTISDGKIRAAAERILDILLKLKDEDER